MFNPVHNLHKLRSLLPIYGANNIIMDSRIINPTFSPTRFKVVVSVINLTYHIRNLLINKVATTKHTNGSENNKVGCPLGGQVVKLFDLTKYASVFRDAYLSRVPSNPK